MVNIKTIIQTFNKKEILKQFYFFKKGNSEEKEAQDPINEDLLVYEGDVSDQKNTEARVIILFNYLFIFINRIYITG